MIASDPAAIHRIAGCVCAPSKKVRRAAVQLVGTCIQCPNFPLEELLEHRLVDSVLECFEWDDGELHDLCLGLVRQWLSLENLPYAGELLAAWADRNHEWLFARSSFALKCKLLGVYQTIVDLERADIVSQFYTPEWIRVLCEFILIDYDEFPVKVIDLLKGISHMCPQETMDEIIGIVTANEAFVRVQELAQDWSRVDDGARLKMREFLEYLAVTQGVQNPTAEEPVSDWAGADLLG
jgi:hypothetical protein